LEAPADVATAPVL